MLSLLQKMRFEHAEEEIKAVPTKIELSLRASAHTGVAIPSKFPGQSVVGTAVPRHRGLPRRYAPRNDTKFLVAATSAICNLWRKPP